MTRLIGICLTACAALPLFLAAQDQGKESAEQLAKEMLRLQKTTIAEAEAIFKSKDPQAIAAGEEKISKLVDEMDAVAKKIAKLPMKAVQDVDAKYAKEIAENQERMKLLRRQRAEAAKKGEAKKAEPPQEVLKRLKDNLDKAEERLNKKDPGKETVKIQDDIIKDLKELLKQQDPNGGGGGGGAAGGGGGGGSAGNSGGGGASSKGGGVGSDGGGQKGSQANKGGHNTKQAGGGKDDKKNTKQAGGGKVDNKNEKQAGGGSPGGKDKKTGSSGGGGLKNKDAKKENNKDNLADLYKNAWGHLPQTKRQEMETYSKERLVPTYEDLLRQYYRTIAEQSRRD